jgi:hypothetical protein
MSQILHEYGGVTIMREPELHKSPSDDDRKDLQDILPVFLKMWTITSYWADFEQSLTMQKKLNIYIVS